MSAILGRRSRWAATHRVTPHGAADPVRRRDVDANPSTRIEARFLSLFAGASGVQNRRGRIRNGPNVATRCSHGGQKGISEAAP